jgi:hypothetical protein
MEAKMQRIIVVLFLTLTAMVAVTFADVKEFDGPYGMKALVVDRNGEKIFAWKIPSANAKLLFVGSIYDGNENLSLKYQRRLMGIERLEAEAVGLETNPDQKGKKLYIFFDPSCDSCQLLHQIFQKDPPGCKLVWVPVSVVNDAGAVKQGNKWLMSAMPEAVERFSMDEKDIFNAIKNSNYHLISWLRGTDETIAVPTFAWVDENRDLHVKLGDEMTGDMLEEIIQSLKGKAQ